MPKFSEKSIAALETCHPRIQEIFEEIITLYDCSVLEGFRDEKRQNEMVRSGLSQLAWPRSLHNQHPSRAIDVVPYPIDWKDTRRFDHFAGFVQGIAEHYFVRLKWGGDWDSDRSFRDQTFHDLGHFELFPDVK